MSRVFMRVPAKFSRIKWSFQQQENQKESQSLWGTQQGIKMKWRQWDWIKTVILQSVKQNIELKDGQQLYRADGASAVVCSKSFEFCDLENINCRFKDDVRELLHPYKSILHVPNVKNHFYLFLQSSSDLLLKPWPVCIDPSVFYAPSCYLM